MSIVEKYQDNPKVKLISFGTDMQWGTKFALCSYADLARVLGHEIDDEWIFNTFNQRQGFLFNRMMVLIIDYDESEKMVLINRMHS